LMGATAIGCGDGASVAPMHFPILRLCPKWTEFFSAGECAAMRSVMLRIDGPRLGMRRHAERLRNSPNIAVAAASIG
jgi:hypothetical protein